MQSHRKLQDQSSEITIALDGPSASGKGHIGQMFAQEYNLTYIESSKVYRGLAYRCLQDGVALDDMAKIIEIANDDILGRVEGVDLAVEEVGQMASKISVIAQVRDIMNKVLKNLITNNPRVIMEGRDIGTVIAPNADIKVYITADVEIRAERRFKQLRQQGKSCMLTEILNGLKMRDERDMNRPVAPLVPAADAIIVDTSSKAPQQVVEYILENIG